MKDFDRFTEFLRREAAGYNEAPDTPADAMWPGIEVRARLAAGRGKPAGAVADVEAVLEEGLPGDRPPLAAALDYNRPPPAPREDMWARIESAWAWRREAPAARAHPAWLRPAWLGQRGAAGWVVAVAAAASLVLGIGLGRGTRPSQPGEAVVQPSAPATEVGAERSVVASTAVEQAPVETAGVPDPAAEIARTASLRGDVRVLEAPSGGETATRDLMAANTPTGGPPLLTDLFESDYADEATRPRRAFVEPDFDYATARHMDRAATLLTAFRTDRRTPASQEDLARWARGLLADTRMYIGLSDSASPLERDLLHDLELVLIQIAGLTPGAPDFEWDLARESMERRGTLVRLRAASAESET